MSVECGNRNAEFLVLAEPSTRHIVLLMRKMMKCKRRAAENSAARLSTGRGVQR